MNCNTRADVKRYTTAAFETYKNICGRSNPLEYGYNKYAPYFYNRMNGRCLHCKDNGKYIEEKERSTEVKDRRRCQYQDELIKKYRNTLKYGFRPIEPNSKGDES